MEYHDNERASQQRRHRPWIGLTHLQDRWITRRVARYNAGSRQRYVVVDTKSAVLETKESSFVVASLVQLARAGVTVLYSCLMASRERGIFVDANHKCTISSATGQKNNLQGVGQSHKETIKQRGVLSGLCCCREMRCNVLYI